MFASLEKRPHLPVGLGKLFSTLFVWIVAFFNLLQAIYYKPGKTEVYEVEVGHRVIILAPFLITVLLYLSSYAFPQAKKLEQIFQDVYTFLGLPLTCVAFINIMLYYIGGCSTILLPEIPIATLSDNPSKSFHLANLLATLQLPALAFLHFYSPCLVKFRPHIPIIIFNSLFLGVVLDRFSRKDQLSFNTEITIDDVKFCYSLGFQVLLIDFIFIALSLISLDKIAMCRKPTKAENPVVYKQGPEQKDQVMLDVNDTGAEPEEGLSEDEDEEDYVDPKSAVPDAILISI